MDMCPESNTRAVINGKHITIAANFVADGIRESMDYWSAELGISCNIHFLPPDQIIQSLLQASENNIAHSEFVMVLVEPERWRHPEDDLTLSMTLSAFHQLTDAIREATIFCNNVQFIGIICPSFLNHHGSESFGHVEDDLKAEFLSIPGTHFITKRELTDSYFTDNYKAYFDPYADRFAMMPYSRLGFAALGTMLMRKLANCVRAPKKIIVVDCDNTLWDGLCGDADGREIVISERHHVLHRFLVKQQMQGKLVCLCSKNESADVMRVFDQHPGMLLKREHLTAWKISWEPKPQNLRALAQELNVGTDSFIFIDDDPFECNIVSSVMPEVLVLQMPVVSVNLDEYLNRIWEFDITVTTGEDRKRTQYYLEDKQRILSKSRSSSIDDFVASLQLKVECEVLRDEDLPRVVQLINRVNQFNLNGNRYSLCELKTLLINASCWVVRASDRFGDYGLVGVIIGSIEKKSLNICVLLLSCRTLGKGIESHIEEFIVGAARAAGVHEVRFAHRRTPKNTPICDFLVRLGAERNDNEWMITLDG